ncbi:hypothetical protein HAX54_032840 [Datura stramonium]|uniref:Uncharacterized protein n=1 Tax=Datura stramonium TaxID=4076 RepID=A0ABS8VEG1_DATST|nr:hypothetical protein [Datura stramonium]
MRIGDEEATYSVYKSISTPSHYSGLYMIKELIHNRCRVENENKNGLNSNVVEENNRRLLTFGRMFEHEPNVGREMSHKSKRVNRGRSQDASRSRGDSKRLAQAEEHVEEQKIDITVVHLKYMVLYNDIMELGLKKPTTTLGSANLDILKEFDANCNLGGIRCKVLC